MLTENVPLQFLVAGERLTAVLAADPAPPPDHLSQLALLEVEAAAPGCGRGGLCPRWR